MPSVKLQVGIKKAASPYPDNQIPFVGKRPARLAVVSG